MNVIMASSWWEMHTESARMMGTGAEESQFANVRMQP